VNTLPIDGQITAHWSVWFFQNLGCSLRRRSSDQAVGTAAVAVDVAVSHASPSLRRRRISTRQVELQPSPSLLLPSSHFRLRWDAVAAL
jgi:hypothetical protein